MTVISFWRAALSFFSQAFKKSRTMLPALFSDPPNRPTSHLSSTFSTGLLLSRESSTRSRYPALTLSLIRLPCTYLSDFPHLCTSSRQHCSSADTWVLRIQFFHTKSSGQHFFLFHQAKTTWNQLPVSPVMFPSSLLTNLLWILFFNSSSLQFVYGEKRTRVLSAAAKDFGRCAPCFVEPSTKRSARRSEHGLYTGNTLCKRAIASECSCSTSKTGAAGLHLFTSLNGLLIIIIILTTALPHWDFFLFCSRVCFCLYGPFNCIPFHKLSR